MGQPVLAVLGAGAMGANHARVIAGHTGAELGVVVDLDEERARAVADDNGCKWATDAAEALACDAVVVAVPTEHHLTVASAFLEAGRPVLVEKPVAMTTAEVRSLMATAARHDVPLMCGFVERFNPVVRTALDLLDEEPLHVVALRHSPATSRATVSVVHDLLIHDIDLALLFGGRRGVVDVHVARFRPPAASFAEIADCSLVVEGGMVATLSASRAGQRKVRSFVVTAADRVLDLDLLRQDVTVYRHVDEEINVGGAKAYRANTIVDIPFVRHAGEPLALQLSHFVDLVEGRADPRHELDTILAPHLVAELAEA